MPDCAKIFASLAALLTLGAAAQAQCGPPADDVPEVRESLLVSTQWLAAHLRDADLVILAVDHMPAGGSQRSQRIPGARLTDAMTFAVGSMDLPPVATLDSLVQSLGISNTSRVVLYGDPASVGWLYVALDVLGHGDRTAVLDGGLAAWIAEGRVVTTTASAARPAGFAPQPRRDAVVDAAWVRGHLRDRRSVLLDTRGADEYDGSSHDLSRSGHIPGAVNLPWTNVFAQPDAVANGRGSRLKSPAELRALLRTAGVQPGTTPIVYCTVGLRASYVYFVLRYLGHDPRFYDGSMTDWGRRSELPVLTGSARGTP
jgi:thiosulfate/3-mercaptopyruvate sulfurtransferase